MRWHGSSSGTSAFVPPKKSKGNIHLRRLLDKLWFEGALFLKGELTVIIVRCNYCGIHELCYNKELCNDRPCSFTGFTLKEANSIIFVFARLDLVYNDCICI